MCTSGQNDVANGALQWEPEPEGCKGYKSLQTAIICGTGHRTELETAQILLEGGVNINAQPSHHGGKGSGTPKSALHTLAHCYSPGFDTESLQKVTSLVKFMVSSGADINAVSNWKDQQFYEYNGTTLQLSILGSKEEEYEDLYEDLYEEWDDSDSDDDVQEEEFAFETLLIDLGANINAPAAEINGRTAIQAAVSQMRPSEKLINFLVENGADVHAPAGKSTGLIALQSASLCGHINIVKQLLEMGVDPNAAGAEEGGITALEGAAQLGHLDTVVLLLDNGARPTEMAVKFAESDDHFVIAEIIRTRLAESRTIGEID